MRSDYTRSGVRRSGDDYQDIIALDVLVEMLEHPDRYEWAHVEVDDAGFIDDVEALRADGVIVARQVKFSAHPEDAEDPVWSKYSKHLMAYSRSRGGGNADGRDGGEGRGEESVPLGVVRSRSGLPWRQCTPLPAEPD